MQLHRLNCWKISKHSWTCEPGTQNQDVIIIITGRKIAPNTGANATKFFTLATKAWKLVANLATRISNHTLPRDLVIVEDL